MATKVFHSADFDTPAAMASGGSAAWTAAATAWGASMNGDTGAVLNGGLGVGFGVGGLLHDDGSIPATIILSSFLVSFDWAVTHVGGSSLPRSTIRPNVTDVAADFTQGAGASSGTSSVLWNPIGVIGFGNPTRADLFAATIGFSFDVGDTTTTSSRLVISNFTVTVQYQNIGVGSWLVRCAQMTTPTGAVDFVSGFPDAAQVGGTPSATGTIQIPFADTAGAFIYVDGAGAPVDIAGLPAGFTPDSAFTWHHGTQALGASTQVEYHYGTLFDPTLVGNTLPLFNATVWVGGDYETTGMDLTKLGALVGTHVLATLTDDLAGDGLVVTDQVAYDPYLTAALIGTYAILSPAVIRVLPNKGTILGGTKVTITGAGFAAATGVKFGGTAVTSYAIVNDTTITATTADHAIGRVDVEVTSVATGLQLYTYVIPNVSLPPIPWKGATNG